MKSDDPIRKRQILDTLGRKLESNWRPAAGHEKVVQAIESALGDPATRAAGIAAAAATGDRRYAEKLVGYLNDEKLPAEDRVAALEAIGQLRAPQAGETLNKLIAQAKEQGASTPLAEAAIRTLPRLGDAKGRLSQVVRADDMPLGLRREALRTLAQQGREGGMQIVNLAKNGELSDALKTDAAVALNTHPDRQVRDEAGQVLPLPKSKAGKPLPQLYELVRREGDAGKGRDIFFLTEQNACGGCHRVQGRGNWVGPDLSTIGTKYGKDELLRSILSPSAAIGYNYRSLVLALDDGRVITGLPVEEAAGRLVLKTADGERIAVRTAEIDDRKTSDVSLMPEGLAESLGEQDLVDLLAFLTTLKQPVSIVGQFQAIGPVAEPNGKPALDPSKRVDPKAGVKGPDGQTLSWRRLTADAEGRIDLTPLGANDPSKAVYLHAPVASSVEQKARLVLDTKADVRAWLGGKELSLPAPSEDGPRSVEVTLPNGTTDLVVRVPGHAEAALVATFVADRPIEFSPVDTTRVSAR